MTVFWITAPVAVLAGVMILLGEELSTKHYRGTALGDGSKPTRSGFVVGVLR